MIWMLLNLAGAVAALALWMWALLRVGHGGKGWPRLRRGRNHGTNASREYRQVGQDLPTRNVELDQGLLRTPQ